MDVAAVSDWVERYRVAWESNERADIEGLFTEDAHYLDAPGREPWTPRDEIVAKWLDQKDEPGDTTFTFEVIGIAGDVAFVRGVSEYHTEPHRFYDNLWEITLDDDGRCSRFVEWYMKRD